MTTESKLSKTDFTDLVSEAGARMNHIFKAAEAATAQIRQLTSDPRLESAEYGDLRAKIDAIAGSLSVIQSAS